MTGDAFIDGSEHKVGNKFPSCYDPCNPVFVKDIDYHIFFVSEWRCLGSILGEDRYEMVSYRHSYGHEEHGALYLVGKNKHGAHEYAIKRGDCWYKCRRELGVGSYYIIISESEL